MYIRNIQFLDKGKIHMTNVHYYLNTEFIKNVMTERKLSVKQLVDGSEISARRIKRYLNGTVYNRIPLEIVIVLMQALNVKFDDLTTLIPPKPQK